MKFYAWNEEKNKWLKKTRNISFEDIVAAIDAGAVLDDTLNPNQTLYPNQRAKIIKLNNYAYVVPYIEDEQKYFLKTAFPSRNATRKYIKRKEVYEKSKT